MSGKLAVQVYELELTPAERDVLLAMALNANDDGSECRPGVRLLAWRTGYTERHVQRTLRDLETKRILVVTDRPLSKPVVYKIVLSAGTKKKAFEPRPARASGDITMSPLEGVTGAIQMSPLNEQRGDTQMSPPEMSPVTSHGKQENVTGDMASANLLRSRPKDERPIKDKERSASAAPITGLDRNFMERRLYYSAFEMAFPEKARVKVPDKDKNHAVAQFLYANGYDPLEVTELVRDKLAQGKTDYRFEYLQEDMGKKRLASMVPLAPKAPAPNGNGKHVPPPTPIPLTSPGAPILTRKD